MRTWFVLWKKELASYFFSPMAYVMMMFFLAIMGFSFWLLAVALSQGAESTSIMTALFGDSIFFWMSMLIVAPLLTMRLIAEEKRSGTIETLMTAPVSDVSVVLAKYFGALTFFVVMWSPTSFYAWSLMKFAPFPSIDLWVMGSSSLGVFLIGALYLAAGIFASSLTQNQMGAAMICFAVLCLVFLSGFISYFARTGFIREISAYVSSVQHMGEFSRGVLDTRPLVFYGTAVVGLLFATVKVVESRKWK
ncbi:MAG: ABC transporter permease subunit [Kiritimatiellae bacterium]|nr:ABC transporter permease subunit [Kiritimatiellia bacterium]